MTTAIDKKVIVLAPKRNVSADIRTFLDDKAINSPNTSKTYSIAIRDFFKETRHKEIDELTEDDLVFRHTEIRNYRLSLINAELSHSSINVKMTAIRMVMEFLAREYEFIRPEVFKVDKLKEKTESYGDLTWIEVLAMIQAVQKYQKGFEKSVLIELAARTSIRLEALLNLTWDQVKNIDGVWVVDVYDKGTKENVQSIPNELYEKMCSISPNGPKLHVFSLSDKTCRKMIHDLCHELRISKERNIVFHSLRKVVINEILATTGDIVAAAEHANHGDINTTMKHYKKIRRISNLATAPSMMIGQKIDTTPIHNLTHDQLLSAIEMLSPSAKSELLNLSKKV